MPDYTARRKAFRYVLVGFTAFVLLVPLALTSTKGAMRRLGKRWKPLHRLVYLAALLAVVHFVWLVKADVREPSLESRRRIISSRSRINDSHSECSRPSS